MLQINPQNLSVLISGVISESTHLNLWALLIVWWIRRSHHFKVEHAKRLHMGPMLELWGPLLFGIHQTLSRAPLPLELNGSWQDVAYTPAIWQNMR